MTSEAEKILLNKYLNRLPDKLVEINSYIVNQEKLNLQSAIHKLAGSAGMYGFKSISETAAEIEDLIIAGESLSSEKFQILFDVLSDKINDTTVV